MAARRPDSPEDRLQPDITRDRVRSTRRSSVAKTRPPCRDGARLPRRRLRQAFSNAACSLGVAACACCGRRHVRRAYAAPLGPRSRLTVQLIALSASQPRCSATRARPSAAAISYESLGAPVAWRMVDKALPTGCPSRDLGHVGLYGGFVDEGQPFQMPGHEGPASADPDAAQVGHILTRLCENPFRIPSLKRSWYPRTWHIFQAMIDPSCCFYRTLWRIMWGRTMWSGSSMHSLMDLICMLLASVGSSRRAPVGRGTIRPIS